MNGDDFEICPDCGDSFEYCDCENENAELLDGDE